MLGISLVSRLSLPRLIAAGSLLARYKGLTVNDLEASHISDLLGAIGVEHPPELVQALLSHAKEEEDPTLPLIAWGRKKLEDGTLANLVRSSASQAVRCPHCGNPLYLNPE